MRVRDPVRRSSSIWVKPIPSLSRLISGITTGSNDGQSAMINYELHLTVKFQSVGDAEARLDTRDAIKALVESINWVTQTGNARCTHVWLKRGDWEGDTERVLIDQGQT